MDERDMRGFSSDVFFPAARAFAPALLADTHSKNIVPPFDGAVTLLTNSAKSPFLGDYDWFLETASACAIQRHAMPLPALRCKESCSVEWHAKNNVNVYSCVRRWRPSERCRALHLARARQSAMQFLLDSRACRQAARFSTLARRSQSASWRRWSSRKSCLTSYSTNELYSIVADVDSYSKFLPCCVGSRTLGPPARPMKSPESDGAEKIVDAELSVGFASIRESYVSEVRMFPGQWVKVRKC